MNNGTVKNSSSTKDVGTAFLMLAILLPGIVHGQAADERSARKEKVTITATGQAAETLQKREGKLPVTGTVGLDYFKTYGNDNFTQFSANIAIASTNNAVAGQDVREFGSDLLNSTIATGIGQFDLRVKNVALPVIGNTFGMHLQASASSATWRKVKADSSIVQDANSVKVGLSARLTYTPIYIKDPENDVCLTLESGYSMKTLAGDVVQNKETAMQFLGTEDIYFHGLNCGIEAKINVLRAYASYELLWSASNPGAKVAGLTDGQLMFGISATAGLFSL